MPQRCLPLPQHPQRGLRGGPGEELDATAKTRVTRALIDSARVRWRYGLPQLTTEDVEWDRKQGWSRTQLFSCAALEQRGHHETLFEADLRAGKGDRGWVALHSKDTGAKAALLVALLKVARITDFAADALAGTQLRSLAPLLQRRPSAPASRPQLAADAGRPAPRGLGRFQRWLLRANPPTLVVMAIWNLDEGGKWQSEAGAEGPPPNLPPTNAAGIPWVEGDRFDDATQHHLVGADKAIFRTGGFAAPAPAPARGETIDHGRQPGLSDNKGPGLSGGVALTSDQDIFRTGGVALTSDKDIFRTGGLVGTDKGMVRSGG